MGIYFNLQSENLVYSLAVTLNTAKQQKMTITGPLWSLCDNCQPEWDSLQQYSQYIAIQLRAASQFN